MRTVGFIFKEIYYHFCVTTILRKIKIENALRLIPNMKYLNESLFLYRGHGFNKSGSETEIQRWEWAHLKDKII